MRITLLSTTRRLVTPLYSNQTKPIIHTTQARRRFTTMSSTPNTPASTAGTSTPSEKRKLKILMLHGNLLPFSSSFPLYKSPRPTNTELPKDTPNPVPSTTPKPAPTKSSSSKPSPPPPPPPSTTHTPAAHSSSIPRRQSSSNPPTSPAMRPKKAAHPMPGAGGSARQAGRSTSGSTRA